MISREVYLQKLRQLKDQRLIKVITGIRRSGKSTVLTIFKNELIDVGVEKKNIIFFNFEERENLHLTNWSTLYDEVVKGITSKKRYFFIA
jgi:predicted AAA+ superfamily ATPase